MVGSFKTSGDLGFNVLYIFMLQVSLLVMYNYLRVLTESSFRPYNGFKEAPNERSCNT